MCKLSCRWGPEQIPSPLNNQLIPLKWHAYKWHCKCHLYISSFDMSLISLHVQIRKYSNRITTPSLRMCEWAGRPKIIIMSVETFHMINLISLKHRTLSFKSLVQLLCNFSLIYSKPIILQKFWREFHVVY